MKISNKKTASIFVYGTLRPAYKPNPVYNAISKYIEKIIPAKVQGKIYLIENSFPAFVETRNVEDWVYGDILKLIDENEVFNVLDVYEEFDSNNIEQSLYIRKIIKCLLLSNNEIYESQIYVYNKQVDDASLISSGDFLSFQKL